MSDDSFTHDEERFDAADVTGGVEVADPEARYAELFAEVIWDGVITAERRQRLTTAAELFGVSPKRAQLIEQALMASHKARYKTAVVEEEGEATQEMSLEELTAEDHTVAPLAPSTDPRFQALQRRIDVIEDRNETLGAMNRNMTEHVGQLEGLVEQLQYALESTLEELDEVHQQLAELEVVATVPRPATAEVPALELEEGEEAAPETFARPILEVGSGDEGNAEGRPLPDVAAGAELMDATFDEATIPEAAQSLTRQRGGDSRERLTDWEPSRIPDEIAEPLAAVRRRRDNPTDIHQALFEAPRDAALLHDLFNSLQRGDDLDRRWCIAHALTFLGEANDAEAALHEAHAHDGLVRPKRSVNDDEWRELLCYPGEEQLTGEILGVVAPALLIGDMASMRASITNEVLDPDAWVDPKTSTLQAVRSMSWAAAFLGLKVPSMYLCPELEGTADVVLNPTPCSRLGSHLLTGRSAKELAFAAGHHLSWYRREHMLGQPRRSLRHLEDMFLAALMIGNPGLPMTEEVKERVEPTARGLRPLLTREAVDKLQACFTRFVELGGRTDLARWYGRAERTATCAGMLLANDLGAARAMIQIEQPDRVERVIDDLIVFFTAVRCSKLRKRVGIDVAVNDG